MFYILNEGGRDGENVIRVAPSIAHPPLVQPFLFSLCHLFHIRVHCYTKIRSSCILWLYARIVS